MNEIRHSPRCERPVISFLANGIAASSLDHSFRHNSNTEMPSYGANVVKLVVYSRLQV